MPFIVLSVIVQIAFILHILKTGRNTTWIWVVMMLPAAGAAAYFIMEILPDLSQSRTGVKAQKGLGKLINPNKDFNHATNNYTIVDTVENSTKLAAEYLNKGLFAEAKVLYEKCLTGIHENDPDMMYGLAQAEYGLEDYAQTRQVLDDLIKHNPSYKNVDAHLLFAKCLVNLNETDAALKEFKALNEYYPGPEATYRYAMLLQSLGQDSQAEQLLEKILQNAKLADKHYRARYKPWINKAKQALRQ
ncbi:MAG: tetratricopeptide repeat protein [Leucothrix sp.]